jgi:hypothetical protein
MERPVTHFDRLLTALARVPFVELLLAAAFGLPTWLIAAVGGMATVYLVGSDGQPRSATALLASALVGAALVAVGVTAITFIWMLVREVVMQWQASDRAVAWDDDDIDPAPEPIEQPILPEPEPEPEPAPVRDRWPEPEPRPAPALEPDPEPAPVRPLPPPTPPPPIRKAYRAAELDGRLHALDEISAQLDGPISEAHEFGHALANLIDEACRHYSRQEIVDRLGVFRSVADETQRALADLLERHAYEEITEMAPWRYERVIDKTSVLMMLIPLVPEQALRSDNLSAPTLRAAGAEWIAAIEGFGSWIVERQRKIKAQRFEYHCAEVID